jgi:DNA polymerase-3 subunit delta
MITKYFEIQKINILINYVFLFYGDNEGLKNDLVKNIFEKNYQDNIYKYDEIEILNNREQFMVGLFSKSFFEDKKLIIISRVTDKIKNIIEEIIEKRLTGVVIILLSGGLEKKSKIRQMFERSTNFSCVAFYPDNHQTLSTIARNFFIEKKVPISTQIINILTDRAGGDRQNLQRELAKIEGLLGTRLKITIEDILKLTNLVENHDISELVDNCLAKNKRRTIKILNENNYSIEDSIIIIRTFLSKSKRLLKLFNELQIKKNIDLAITSTKPPIFWKDKDIVKQQMQKSSINSVRNLIYKINDMELLIKKNNYSSINLLSNFVIEQSNI